MPLAPSAPPAVQAQVVAIGRDLFQRMDRYPTPTLLSRKGVYARLMEWSMRDPAFKAQLFRFVDVLPVLNASGDVVQHLREYLGDRAVELHPALKAGLGAAGFAPGLVAGPIKAQVTDMARQFVAGVSPDDLLRRLRHNARHGLATTIDLLGETVVSEAEADRFLARNLEVLDTVSAGLAEIDPAFSDQGPQGPLPRLNLSVKVSALTPEVNPADPAGSIQSLATRLRPILRRATQLGAFINFDMESYKLKDLTLELFRTILSEPEFATAPAAGLALQAYLRDAENDLHNLIAWARERQRPITVRLVKGAYWDYETILAEQRGWPIPVWTRKAETDVCYETLTHLLLEHADLVTPAFASHNVRSCAHAIAWAEQRGIDGRAYEFQALYGMADDLKHALLERGHRVREYCPIGELLPGMAYLVRRLLENTSNEGFLRARATGAASIEALLQDPREALPADPQPPASAHGIGFRNAPLLDLSRRAARDLLTGALGQVRTQLGRDYPLVIGTERRLTSRIVPSVNPARPAEIIGRWACATAADAEAAIASARSAQPAWARTPVAERAALLDRVAAHLQSRRAEFAAWQILEAGKTWPEADADVAEAIDFCRYYAAQMRERGRPRRTQGVPGELNVEVWQPRGVGVVIAPWNFPLAILCGMTVAPLVAGNAVIMKPAEQTSIIAAHFMQALLDCGCPPGVVNFLPGIGEEIGPCLVAHPHVDFIAFTGSRAVGLQIWEAAGRTAPGQENLKKVVCEMGGKNALIIDADADLDEAIPCALASAFGFSGQKCSALSRLIVLEEIHDTFVERFLAGCASLRVGDPADPATVVGPVIDEEAHQRILRTIKRGRSEAQLAFQGQVPSTGYFVPPTVFTGVLPDHRLAREEIFGPVLGILRARDLDQAFAWFNDSEYALTGGIFSRRPSTLARAREELRVGNLYINRGITGAIVERQPFGGFKMSGGGTKAGGPAYLENFLFSRVITENVLRRGFTPPEAV